MRTQTRRERMVNQRKRSLYMRLLSSFMITGVVIASVTILASAAVEIEVVSLSRYENYLYYAFEIIDEDETIKEGSLTLVVSGPNYHYETSICVDYVYGSLDDLPDEAVVVSIIGSQGYGRKTFFTTTVEPDDYPVWSSRMRGMPYG